MNNLMFSDFIAQQIILDRAMENLFSWGKILGIEGAVELVERNKDKPYAQMYVDLLKERGLIK